MATHPKMKGQVIAQFNGFTIYGDLKKAKRTGKDRVWICIRQDDRGKYRVSESLSYARSVDIQFEATEIPSPR